MTPSLPHCLCLLGCMIIASSTALAQNPVCPEGSFFSDPQARVWNGRVYLYGSRDERAGQWCSHHQDVLEGDTLLSQWTLHRDVLASRGPGDEIAGTDALLFASDCFRHDSLYRLVYCTPDGRHAEGIATGTSPTGPFRDGHKIEGPTEIDPSVIIDDDGRPWLFWGQYSLKAARLTPDLSAIDSTTLREGILTREQHFFHEGVQAFRRGDTYYLCYADESRGRRPTCLGYATSKHLLGPYTYRGIIIDNDGCDPDNWNNHGSVVQVGSRWYVFYHRATNGTSVFRKTCIEPIVFTSDGLIPEVEPTTNGAAPLLDPRSSTEARRACRLSGHVRVSTDSGGQETLAEIRDGDTALFRYYDFPRRGLKRVVVTLQAREPLLLTVSVGGRPVASRLIQPSPGPTAVSMPLTCRPPRGRQSVTLCFTGSRDRQLAIVSAFRFE